MRLTRTRVVRDGMRKQRSPPKRTDKDGAPGVIKITKTGDNRHMPKVPEM